MFGSAHKKDTGTLPIFVHALQSADAFNLAQKVWEANTHALLVDPANHKEFMQFRFTQPECVVWLQRDQGRTDTFELILMWDVKKEELTEVYVISALAGVSIGDDRRAKDLLNAILTMPSTVPVEKQV